jgi:hypothetical protein
MIQPEVEPIICCHFLFAVVDTESRYTSRNGVLFNPIRFQHKQCRIGQWPVQNSKLSLPSHNPAWDRTRSFCVNIITHSVQWRQMYPAQLGLIYPNSIPVWVGLNFIATFEWPSLESNQILLCQYWSHIQLFPPLLFPYNQGKIGRWLVQKGSPKHVYDPAWNQTSCLL